MSASTALERRPGSLASNVPIALAAAERAGPELPRGWRIARSSAALAAVRPKPDRRQSLADSRSAQAHLSQKVGSPKRTKSSYRSRLRSCAPARCRSDCCHVGTKCSRVAPPPGKHMSRPDAPTPDSRPRVPRVVLVSAPDADRLVSPRLAVAGRSLRSARGWPRCFQNRGAV